MSRADDKRRQDEIDTDPIARAIHDAIDVLPMQTRLYPDLYALQIAEAVRRVTSNNNGEQR